MAWWPSTCVFLERGDEGENVAERRGRIILIELAIRLI